jgi:putative ABC transport system permease protein
MRNRLYAAISLVGLALGLAVALFTGLYIRDELSFDRFIPSHDRAYVLTSTLKVPGQGDVTTDYAPAWMADDLRLAFPQATAVARLAYGQGDLRAGGVETREDIAWVDPAFFDILPLPALAGDPRRAMDDPGNVVISRAAARKYFGQDAPIGEILELDRAHPLRVAAVIADLPAETHLTQQVFASGRAAFSPLARLGQARGGKKFASFLMTERPGQQPNVRFEYVRLRTYLRLDDAAGVQVVSRGLTDFARDIGPLKDQPPKATMELALAPLSALHLQAFKGANLGVGEPHGSVGALYGLGATAGLVLALAVINFVNLTTARAGRRAVEVGVRKVAGAQRRHLMAQFLGEACLYAAAAMVLAVALVEMLLPALNGFLMRGMTFAYWRDPALLAGLAVATVALGAAAGAYPAFVLSGFRPAVVLKGGPMETGGSGLVRQGLVIAQFVVLIVLILAVAVIWRQTRYAMNEGLRLDKDQVLVVHATPCRGAFLTEVARLPGVRAAACSSRGMLGLDDFDPTKFVMDAQTPGGPVAHVDLGLADFGLFELYGVKPLAGRLFARGLPGDELALPGADGLQHGSVIVNAAAARKLGFARPQDAVGRRVVLGPGAGDFEVVGVVPDFTLDLLNATVKPTAYQVNFALYPADQVLSVKLDGAAAPETLGAIDRLWKATGRAGPIRRQFLDDYVQRLYVGTVRQAFLVSVLCGLALFLAGLGLLGLAAFTAERRTKEIGVRKAMGASTRDILALLIWQFTRPVLVAWVIAWPIGWWAMSRWLDGFAYRIALSPWMFVAAGLAALAIAWATVGSHAWAIARRKPVAALRYE